MPLRPVPGPNRLSTASDAPRSLSGCWAAVTRWPLLPSFGGGPVGEGWAAGLEERDGGWWPRFDRDVRANSPAENARRSFWDEWKRIVCPTLAVLAQSGTIAPHEVDGMLRQGPVTQAVSIPGTGHDLHLEQPGTLYTLLSGFLDELAHGRR
ncbi:alpha/beta fold hydrolase [Streptomyces sp. NTH33]|uniref:alpha/beta fold hydrolase n=1 Tax=Streptomyces sp. NTH33 TaxID=1735453 RepID=UPI0015E8B760|nr:alpha/beta hydrolase [Streptomyces sp. NTH33]